MAARLFRYLKSKQRSEQPGAELPACGTSRARSNICARFAAFSGVRTLTDKNSSYRWPRNPGRLNGWLSSIIVVREMGAGHDLSKFNDFYLAFLEII